MKMPEQILVVISGKRKKHEALERALKFAEYNDIHIHLFNSIYEPVLELTDVLSSDHRKEMKEQYLADRKLYMNSLREEVSKQGISCSVRVEWHRDLHEIIEEVVKELKPDLVIKHISAEPMSINPFALPIDRHLIRYCQAPLLLVKQSQWTDSPILAAVDILTSDSDHQSLNKDILESAKVFSHLYLAPLHVVNAFITHTVSAGIDFPMLDMEQLNRNTESYHREKLSELLETNHIEASSKQLHAVAGVPEVAISQVVKQLNCQLVIMGSVGRKGISAALMGNTAEAVLAELNCEVLCLKPR
jgi:universal stress protein E